MPRAWPRPLFAALVFSLFLAGCGRPQPPPFATQSPGQVVLNVRTDTSQPVQITLTPSASPGPVRSPTYTFTPAPTMAICSPLEGIPFAELAQPDLLKNPFQLPRPGMDDGHFGADFAYWSRGERNTMLGLPVQSVLNGRVAGIIHNRTPYGNAIIIETTLDSISPGQAGVVPTRAPTVSPAPNLYCPPDPVRYPAVGRSLYLLYAHLNKEPEAALHQPVACGQVIGEVGTTGNSVNPHLHLETRVGPAGVTFPEMAHYDNAATQSEMSAYCTWRVSGLFQAFDPLKLLSLQP